MRKDISGLAYMCKGIEVEEKRMTRLVWLEKKKNLEKEWDTDEGKV